MSYWTDRTAKGICGDCGQKPVQQGFARCTDCLTQARVTLNTPESVYSALDYTRLHAPVMPPVPVKDQRNKIAHCGQWWPIECFPWTAPCCGTVYGLKEEG